MDFELTEEQEAIRETFRSFADREIRPEAADLDENPRFPRELFDKAGALGFFAMRYPEPEGRGADILSYLLAVEELARGSLAVAASCTMQSLMGTWFLHKHGLGETRERLLGPALKGEVIGTICMTEPDAGSDLFSMTTKAVDAWPVTTSLSTITFRAPPSGSRARKMLCPGSSRSSNSVSTPRSPATTTRPRANA